MQGVIVTRKLQISIVGGEGTPHELQLARSLGRIIAEHDLTLVTGGMDGIMEAASLGAFDGTASSF